MRRLSGSGGAEIVKERPILFSAPMVRAILDGMKTQTRRLMKPQMVYGDVCGIFASWYLPTGPDSGTLWPNGKEKILSMCPYGQPGDRLWVRETWAQPTTIDPGPTFYRADYPRCVPTQYENVPLVDAITWKPSIHMPRSQCRLVLEVTGVRVERLNHISESDARAEGVDHIRDKVPTARDSFRYLWETLYGAESWTANPWVWVVEFKCVDGAKGA
jgi:hypothetical protein